MTIVFATASLILFRLATSRLAKIFSNGTIYRHDKKLKRAKPPELTKPNKPSAEGTSELRAGRPENRKKYLNCAKDFAKV